MYPLSLSRISAVPYHEFHFSMALVSLISLSSATSTHYDSLLIIVIKIFFTFYFWKGTHKVDVNNFELSDV